MGEPGQGLNRRERWQGRQAPALAQGGEGAGGTGHRGPSEEPAVRQRGTRARNTGGDSGVEGSGRS